MAAGITLGIAADTRPFASAIRSGVLQPLEGVERALDDVGDAGSDAEAELVGGFRGAQAASKDLERQTERMVDTIRREARQASRSVREIGDDGFERSSEATRNFRDEATQNFSEVASSFDGSLQGITDGIQGTLGGAASAVSGPIGLALGGLAVVAGTVGSAWAARAEEIKQAWQDMYDDMVESGQGFLSQDLINRRIQEVFADQGKLNAAVAEGRQLGVDYTDIVRAQAGDLTALGDVLAAARDALTTQNEAQDEFIAKNGEESAAIADKQGQYELLIEKYGRLLDAQNSSANAALGARDAMNESAEANRNAAGSLDDVTDSANAIPSGKSVAVTADTSAYYAKMEQLRRDKFNVDVDVWVNQRRGTTLP